MFNLPVKQVHNLLRSTHCHWQGPAIARNSCFGNQLIWAGGERLLGPAGRKQLEDVSWTRAVCFPSALPGHLGVDLRASSSSLQPTSFTAPTGAAGCPGSVCSSHQEQKLCFLPRYPRSSVTGSSWECPPKTEKLPASSPACSLSMSVCQGQLSSSLTQLLVSRKGATTLARDLVAPLCEIPWRFHQQERLGRKIRGKEMEKGKGGPDGTECYQSQSWFKIFSWG